MNQRMAGVETMFLSTDPEHSYLSSSLVKEIARWGGPLDGTVPAAVEVALRARFAGEPSARSAPRRGTGGGPAAVG
jgi:pantetheine-phosphate adenylyltransferase